jgi:hypothetical protein
MRGEREQRTAQRREEDKTLDAVSYEAQKAILDATMGEFRKDRILNEAVTKILKIAERRQGYKIYGTDRA